MGQKFRNTGYLDMAIFLEFWAILSHFGPFLGTQNFLNFAPCIILSLVTFSHQLSGINIVLNAFFKSFYSEIVNFELNWGFLGVFEGPIFIGTIFLPETTWNMFIGSNYTPVQKSRDGPFFSFFLAPFASLDLRPQ